MFPQDSQGGTPFGSSGGPFGGGFGSEPPLDGMFGQPSLGDGFDFDESQLFGGRRHGEDVINIGLHFHEKLRGMKG